MFDRFFDWLGQAHAGEGGYPSTKRLNLTNSVSVLCGLSILIGSSIAYRVAKFGDVGAGGVAALVAVTGPLAGLVGASYRKHEAQP